MNLFCITVYAITSGTKEGVYEKKTRLKNILRTSSTREFLYFKFVFNEKNTQHYPDRSWCRQRKVPFRKVKTLADTALCCQGAVLCSGILSNIPVPSCDDIFQSFIQICICLFLNFLRYSICCFGNTACNCRKCIAISA